MVNGANFFQINSLIDGARSSSSVSYLHPNLNRPNLTVRTGAWVKKIVVDDGRTMGVELTAFGRTARVDASGEVIVSAGAIDSPKLLMLSGIEPADHLCENGIEVLVDSPGWTRVCRIIRMRSSYSRRPAPRCAAPPSTGRPASLPLPARG